MVALRLGLLLGVFTCTLSHQAIAWNAIGHSLVVLIAIHHLKPTTLKTVEYYNRMLSPRRYNSLVNAGIWLDTIRFWGNMSTGPLHYIDLGFSEDGTPYPPPPEANAVSAINNAIATIQSPNTSPLEKAFSYRILLHVVGDIYQPMHTISRYSQHYPEGDRGGNLFFLMKNPVALNLHAYWDRGGGWLLKAPNQKKYPLASVAASLEKDYPCDETGGDPMNIMEVIQTSHTIARNKAYCIDPHTLPSNAYQQAVITITQKRIAAAGCHLAHLLNSLDH